MLEAGQLLQQLEGDGADVHGILDIAEIERVRRISSLCLERMQQSFAEWPINGQNANLSMQWGLRLENVCAHATFDVDFEAGTGITRTVAALCELHLYKGLMDSFLAAEALEERQAANDCIWRLQSHNKLLNIKSDNIW